MSANFWGRYPNSHKTREDWLVFADKLMVENNPLGEVIALNLNGKNNNAKAIFNTISGKKIVKIDRWRHVLVFDDCNYYVDFSIGYQF